ncbi:glycoside-pentoside-hexuronide (GPH):cation symporter [Pseudomonas silvicola]|nr:glycoside-pentoside-hexuronide (GPH):cation symporter [Pseudomonas silvicola]
MDHKVSFAERLSYGCADGGINLLLGLVSSYLLFFYTDVFHLSVATIGTLFLVARLLDAVADPVIGLLIDRTRTRFGQHRPWFLWFGLPFALCGVLTFATPDLSAQGKITYAFISYTLLGLLYSAVSLPLTSMLPTLSADAQQRTEINALRQLLGTGGVLVIGLAAMPSVHWLGQGDDRRGFMLTAAVCALLALIALSLAFVHTRERVPARHGSHPLTLRQSLSATRGNWPWLATMLINFLFWVGFVSVNQFTLFYLTYNLQRADLIPVVMATGTVKLLTIALCPWLTRRWGMRPTVLLGCVATVGATLAMAWVHEPVAFITLNLVAKLGMGLVIGLLFAMMGEAVNYGEWKNGVRAQGFLFAASSFGVKLGMSIGGALGAGLLAWGHYVPNTPVQSPATMQWLEVGFVWVPVLAYLGIVLSLLLYRFAPGYAPRQSNQVTPCTPPQTQMLR